MATVNTMHKRVAKASLALLVATRGLDPRWAALGFGEVAATRGLQLGDLGSLDAMTAYANGVADNGERVSNRRWAQYPEPIARTARKLADEAVAAIDDLLQ
ncbi:MAG: hypothetical protein GWN58_25575 [Anaerolineae bacterium]|nr:hypothetical protein [Anaerolineae bacterium]